MQLRLVPFLSTVFTCVVWTCGWIFAQPPAGENPPPPRAPAGDLIRESDLKFHLFDKNGILTWVPNFTFEDFLEFQLHRGAIQAKQGVLPETVFAGAIDVDGRVDAEKNFARLQVTFQIVLTARADAEATTWTPIPLRLDNSYLDVGAIEHEGGGEIYVGKDGAAYVCWLRGAPDGVHTIRLPIKVPIRRSGLQDALNVTLPNMSATLRLTVADKAVEAFIPSGRSNVSWETKDGTTVITVESGGGELDLAWRHGGQDVPPALEATCATTVHVHGNRIWSEAQLKVRSQAEPIESFIVRLPAGMELTSRSDAEFHFSDEDGGQDVLVRRLGGPTRGFIEVHLEAQVPMITAEPQRRSIQLAGFSVQDSVREWGSVDAILDGSWSPTWQPGQFVQRVAVPEDPARQPPVAARFLYDRQPYKLQLDLNPKLTRVSFDNTYIVDVSDDKIQLDARIAYSTNDAKADSLSFRMPGWTIDSVTPPESLAKPFSVDGNGVLTLPIAAGATKLDLRVRAQRTIEKNAAGVSFDLPRPTDPELLPNATLIVLASDHVELTPELASMKWLIQETRTPTVELPARFAAPLLFREELSTESPEAAQFVATRRIRPRETTVAVTSDATLDGGMIQVHQSFAANVAYAPLAELTIAIPTSVAASGTLRIASGDEELAVREAAPPEPVPDPPAVAPAHRVASQTTIGIVSLPTPVTGQVQVDITFEIPLKDVVSAEGLRIPLVQPAGDEATENVTNALTVRADENTAINLADEMWTVQSDAALPSHGKHELRVRATGVLAAALVQTSIVESQTGGSTSIPRVWIQSWLDPTGRHDRVCFQLLSDQPLVRFRLPANAQIKELRVLTDGEQVEFVDHGDRSLSITLADEQVARAVGLEMLYFCETVRDSRFDVSIPSIIGTDRAERVYWQIVLPRDEHLAWTPATLTSELVWQLDHGYWGRRGRLEQQALEELVGASTLNPVAPETNRYLFSSTGTIQAVGFVRISRLLLMLASSGLALAMVLPFIYLPTLRQPPVFFVIGVMLCGIAATYPDYSAMVGQAGAIGLGLAILACALQRLVGTRPATPLTRRGSVYVTPDSQANGAPVRVPEGSSRATTATAPAHLQVAQVEGES